MDWKLLLGGALLAIIGGFIVFRFRKSNFNRDLGAGCIMSLGAILLLTGFITAALGLLFKSN